MPKYKWNCLQYIYINKVTYFPQTTSELDSLLTLKVFDSSNSSADRKGTVISPFPLFFFIIMAVFALAVMYIIDILVACM
jgi:hypothetical protein